MKSVPCIAALVIGAALPGAAGCSFGDDLHRRLVAGAGLGGSRASSGDDARYGLHTDLQVGVWDGIDGPGISGGIQYDTSGDDFAHIYGQGHLHFIGASIGGGLGYAYGVKADGPDDITAHVMVEVPYRFHWGIDGAPGERVAFWSPYCRVQTALGSEDFVSVQFGIALRFAWPIGRRSRSTYHDFR